MPVRAVAPAVPQPAAKAQASAAEQAPAPPRSLQAEADAAPVARARAADPVLEHEVEDRADRPGAPVAFDPDANYLPRSVLTVGPRPQAPVLVDYPYFDGEADHYTGEFDLFIDDTGSVVRVATATPDLPGILGNSVREAFLAARFVPGEVDGRPVRSRMRIEVTFDSRRLPSS